MDHPPGEIRLGITTSHQPFDLGAADLAQHVFLPGVTGSGKTTTLLRLAEGELSLGDGLVIVDCKGGDLGGVAREVARRFGVPFRIVDPDDPDSLGYNPCSGNAASVTNKLLGAFSYPGAAEIYKLTAAQALPPIVRALQAQGNPVTLETLYAAFGKGGMGRLARASDEPHRTRLAELEQGRGQQGSVGDQAYTGLQYRLGALLEGKFGDVFRATPALDWDEALATPGVTYLALSATDAGEDVELFGRVIAQDLKQVSARRLRSAPGGEALVPALVVFDEFAALREAEQLTDLLLQARQAQLRVVISTQYLPESVPVRKACLGSGLIIAHRVEAKDAEDLAAQFGTRKSFEVTHQVDYETGQSAKGSYRNSEEYIFHPQKLRTLRIGQAAVRSDPSDRHAIVSIAPPLSVAGAP